MPSTDPNRRQYHAYRHTRPDGKVTYGHPGTDAGWVKLFGFRDPIVPVLVRERTPEDPPSDYWGWLGTDEPDVYSMIWPSEIQFKMCFPYGPKAEEDRGKGRGVNLVVTEGMAEE